jgi:hypothetical protein
MTMETYRWRRRHLTDPPLTVSVMRHLPDGDWSVRAEDWTLPPQVPATFRTLDQALRGADDAARAERPHDCGAARCDEWTPVPPTA